MNFLRRLMLALAVLVVLVSLPLMGVWVGIGNSNGAGFLLNMLDAAEAQAAPVAEIAAADSALVRVPSQASLQEAIGRVSDGGIIEIQGGTYNAPNGGWRLNNLGKSFTIRAAPGATVVLDGQKSTDILRFQNTARSEGKQIRFEGLTFANGRSTENGVGGALSLRLADALFINCTFRDSEGLQPQTGGGAIHMGDNVDAEFRSSHWINNIARNQGGGMSVSSRSNVRIYDSSFVNNRVNIPNHRVTATGGALHIGNSDVTVINTTFDGNRAGYAGGAIHILGTWQAPYAFSDSPARLVVRASTFRNNVARNDSSVSINVPTEGGAIVVEDHTTAEITDTNFENNTADLGGAISAYRSRLIVDGGYFEANEAIGRLVGGGFGGAIAASSIDGMDDRTDQGRINLPSVELTLRNTIIIGGGRASQTAGGLSVSGDVRRQFGLAGVPQMGTKEDNWGRAVLENVIIYNTHVAELDGVHGGGVGGGIVLNLAHATLRDVLILDTHATGIANSDGRSNASGGGMAIIQDSYADMNGLVVSSASSAEYGGGIFAQGSELNLRNCKLINNVMKPGVNEAVGQSYGAAMFSSPDTVRQLNVRGKVEDCIIAGNDGLPVFDDDRTTGAYNDVRYNGNAFHATSFNGVVYSNSLGLCCKRAEELNSLVVTRDSGASTNKSQAPNIWQDAAGSAQTNGQEVDIQEAGETLAPQDAPATGELLAIPVDSSNPARGYYLGYAWAGNQARLNGTALPERSGLIRCPSSLCPETGERVQNRLSVDGQVVSEALVEGPPEPYDTLYVPSVVR